MDDELYELLANYRQALEMSMSRQEQLEEQVRSLQDEVQELNTTLFKEILEPAQAALDNSMREDRFNDFSDKYSDKLGPIADQVNAIEGDDSDFMQAAFDNYDTMEPDENGYKPTDDEYVETLVSETQKKIDAIREAVGAEKVSVEVDENGETEVKADGEDITDEVTDEAGELKSEEEIKEDLAPDGAPVDETVTEEEESIDSPDEVAALEKELEEEAKRFK